VASTRPVPERALIIDLGSLVGVTDPLGALRELADAAEDSAFDALWVGGEEVAGHLERTTVLGALARMTTTLQLGAAPSGAERRPPSILAKIVAGLDVISHGRALVGLRLVDPDDTVEVERLVEACTVVRRVLDGDDPTFDGTFYRVDGAVNQPGPVRAGGVPVVVFVAGGLGAPGSDALTRLAPVVDAVVDDAPGGTPGVVRLDGVPTADAVRALSPPTA
jgi:alkanesulfonate monooxygenase SsuD/methylene tetrahydromethanopterin reductase-like flavin-dependent oxidoreductase (luciferase family)